ncbi:hypothetical protein FQN50_005183 [Emmonsiellopsis sp. PD_5]|nr:hypothetical protein FQN50_005183 [Emmonsiellopsis sp. PD_5]
MFAERQKILLDKGWKYSQGGDTPETAVQQWHPARQLPTTIHLDLLANGEIPDPFIGKNEELVQWVGEKTWIYETSFAVPENLRKDSEKRVELVFEGLDTFATVALNGQEILKSNNMFVGHRVDVTEQIRAANKAQILRITFEGAEAKGQEELEKHPEHDFFTFDEGVTRLAVRKAQYHFDTDGSRNARKKGWDWGPRLLDCGPWKPIYLEAYQSRISDICVKTRIDAKSNRADIDVSVEVEGEGMEYVKVDIGINDVACQSSVVRVHGITALATLSIHNPNLWWPFTFGEQHLYKATVTLLSAQDNAQDHVLDTVEKKFGIRKVELVQQPFKDQEGKSFYFRINNVPIFAAGSCFIPTDSFLPRISPNKYRDWAVLARKSNQVMIRIWGGGIYEHDALYDACDELGILVWQDLMLACGSYAVYPEFQQTVQVEVEQNIKRLRHHPSIVLWCGNNEDYVIPLLRGMEFEEEKDPDKMINSIFPARWFYEHLFPKVCKDLVSDVPYWRGSPYGGEMVNSVTEGDCHQWHVWHLERFPYQDYPQLSARFVSEFGMQAAPSLNTVKKFFPSSIPTNKDGDWTADEYMEWHNKCIGAADNLADYCKDNIPFDLATLQGYIYGTQLIQSEAVSTAYRSWRRLWRGPGQEYCSGALVWQLNDCWPATSWAIADCMLQPKMAFWGVKRENRPITAGLARNAGDQSFLLDAWASNMTLKSLRVSVLIKGWDVRTGGEALDHTLHREAYLAANQTTELGKLNLAEVKPRGECDEKYRNLVFAVYLLPVTSHGLQSPPAAPIARHVNFYEPLKEIPFQSQPDEVAVKISSNGDRSFVELLARVPVKGVMLEFTGDADAEWDDNGVDLVPDEIMKIGFASPKGRADLTVNWLGKDGLQSKTVWLGETRSIL